MMNFPRFSSDASALEGMQDFIDMKINLSKSSKNFTQIMKSSQIGIDEQNFPYFLGNAKPFDEVIEFLPEGIVTDPKQQFNTYFDSTVEFESRDHLINIHCFWITTAPDKMAMIGCDFTFNLKDSKVIEFISQIIEKKSFYYLPKGILDVLEKQIDFSQLKKEEYAKLVYFKRFYLVRSLKNTFAVIMKINKEQESKLKKVLSKFK